MNAIETERCAPQVFIGWVVSPATGQWVNCLDGEQAIRKAMDEIRASSERPSFGEELFISDTAGFQGFESGRLSLYDLEFLAELAEWIWTTDPKYAQALAIWSFEERRFARFADMLEAFQSAFCGIWESEADFAEERWKEELHPELAKAIPSEILESVDWNEVWRGWASCSHKSADLRGTTDVAVFELG